MKPRLVYSPLGGRIYVLTRYTEKRAPNGKPYVLAITKHDVTDDFVALRKRRVRVSGEVGRDPNISTSETK